MSIPTTALDPVAAAQRLMGLDLREPEFRDAISIGYEHASTCTGLHPLSLAGIEAWGWSLGHLRLQLAARGWTIDRKGNFETVVDPSGTVAIAVAAGDSGTGDRNANSRTRTPRGPATQRAVRGNQLNFFSSGHESDHVQTWLLLHYLDPKAEEIRLELALPREMAGKVIEAWAERIILEPIPFDGQVEIDVTIEPDPQIDVDVRRRSN
jgi:hypothetical protein